MDSDFTGWNIFRGEIIFSGGGEGRPAFITGGYDQAPALPSSSWNTSFASLRPVSAAGKPA